MTPDHIEPQSTNWKSRLKFLLPHMALLLATFGYAAVGATLFQRIEQPHETAVHQSSLELIKLQKKQLINRMITTAKNGTSKAVWKETVEKDLLKLTETLYKASQEAYVTAKSLSGGDKESVWSFTASLFFAFTTMATIGYGNVVPITPNGRLMCVGFALIGTPLVIVLIADLGKFFSEFTVRSYQAYQRGKHRLTKCLRFLMKRLRVQLNPHTHPTVTNHIVDNNNVEVRLTCEDEEENPTVPVGVVCGVLLSYMGFGALLFALLEDWSTLDGFYFCFITLTTVGFGDMVPKTKDYKLAIILVYILVGLALTTMCVDLVGVRYIERIHHFGRRFERADLRALLRKRKRIERRLKLKMLSEATTRDRLQPTPAKTPEVNLIEAIEPPDIPEWPCLKPEKSQEVLVFQESPSMDTMSTCSSVYQREVMYPTNALHPGFWLKSTSSWLASGPDLNRCPSAISTEPSVFEREKMYGTLAILTWPQSDELLVDWIPSPIIDFEEMASAAKSQRKVSCPGLFFSQFELFQPKPMKRPVDIPLIRTTLPSSSNSIISTPASTVSDMVMAEEVNFSLGFPVQSVSSESLRSPMVYYQNLPIFVQTNEAVTSEGAIIGAMSCSEKRISGETPKTVTDNVCFVLDGDKVKLTELLADDRWKQTGQPTQYYQSDDLRTFHKVQVIISRGRPIRAKFAQPEATETRSKVVKSSGEDSLDVPLTQVYKVTRYYSFWRSCAGFHRIITIITPTVESDDFKRRFFVQYLWRKASDADRIRVGLEFHQSE